MDRALTDADRWPLLTAAGRELLRALREHPHAPRFNHVCGDRLTAAGLERVRAFETALHTTPVGWAPGEPPPWVREYAAFCLRDVPFYRRWVGDPEAFAALPTAGRADLAREPWAFVPDGQPLDDLLVYNTSGTTGHPLAVYAHPETSAAHLPLYRKALAAHGVTLGGGPGRVPLLLVCWQRRTTTYASVSGYLDQAGFAKVNLYPDEWRDPADRARYLDWCRPDVYTGDPLAFAALAELPLTTRPRALISTSMTLLPGLRQRLETHFGAPVLDLYSLNETGPVAVATPEGHALLPHDLYVEILDGDGQPVPPGDRGEIVVTGGRNPFLALLRYRTGDQAALDLGGTVPLLVGLEGRPPTIFRAADGRPVNNVDVTWALRPFPLAQFTLHQAADRTLTLAVRGLAGAPEDAIRRALLDLFGADATLTLTELPEPATPGGKVIQYVSAAGPGRP